MGNSAEICLVNNGGLLCHQKKTKQRRWFPFILAAAVLPCCSCGNSFFLQVQHPTLKGKYDHAVFLIARLGLFLSTFILTYRAATLRQEVTAVLHLQWPPLCGSAVGHVTWLLATSRVPTADEWAGSGQNWATPPPGRPHVPIGDPPPPSAGHLPTFAGHRRTEECFLPAGCRL